MSLDTAKIVLKNSTLRWSTPGTLNDPYDVQFTLHIDVDEKAVKASALAKLWDAFYGDAPNHVGNELGLVIRALRQLFPKLTRAEFEKEFGKAIDDSFKGVMCTSPSVQEDTRAILANSKILCLTDSPNSELMWAHYAVQ